MKEAGISKGLLFHYFESKIGVYEFVYDYSIKYMMLELTQTIKSDPVYSHLPVILITANTQEESREEALRIGADDYLTKPFAMKELLARVRSQERRKVSYTPNDLTLGSVRLSVSEQELSSKNSIRLSGKEARLMEYLMLNAGKELSTETLFSHVWQQDEVEGEAEDAVWIYISYLRQKLMSINADIGIEGMKGGYFVLKDYSI